MRMCVEWLKSGSNSEQFEGYALHTDQDLKFVACIMHSCVITELETLHAVDVVLKEFDSASQSALYLRWGRIDPK